MWCPRPRGSGLPPFPASALTLLSLSQLPPEPEKQGLGPPGWQEAFPSHHSLGHQSQKQEGLICRRGIADDEPEEDPAPCWAHPASCVSDGQATWEPLLRLPRQVARTHESAGVFSTLWLLLGRPIPSQNQPSCSCWPTGRQGGLASLSPTAPLSG